jgi:hypothetical protein
MRSGDSARAVHWRSSARRGRLVVLERETPYGGGVGVVVAGRAADPGWEPLVTATASAALAALADGRPVTLVARQPGLARLTTSDPTAALDWFAALTDPAWPGAAEVWAAVDGPGGVLLMAATWTGREWWDGVRATAATHQLTVVPVVPTVPTVRTLPGAPGAGGVVA